MPEVNFISVILGDIYLQSGDAIVVPRHSNGSISSITQEGLATLGIKYKPEESRYGSIKFSEVDSKTFSYVVYATSASDRNDIEAIREIGTQLAQVANVNKWRKIVLPLIGTGAGGLDVMEVFITLKAVINQAGNGNNNNTMFAIVVQNPGIYNTIISQLVSDLHALSIKINDQDLFNKQGLINKGLIGFISQDQRSDYLLLQSFYLDDPEDYFYTTDISKEKFSNRNLQPLAPLGYLSNASTNSSIQLHRFFNKSTGKHVFVTNPNMQVLKSYRDETSGNPMFLMKEKGVGLTPVYFYSNSSEVFFIPLIVESEINNDFLPDFVTDANHDRTEDKLEFKNDIESFATVISLKSVEPPLAIGLFGNWGSGKSFFMEKLKLKIVELTSNTKSETYVKNVVHVRFNSWHYSDANLWASLITEIFDSLREYTENTKNSDELGKLSDTLQITSLQKEAVDLRRKELEVSIQKLEIERAKKRKRLEDISGWNFLEIILNNKYIQADLEELKTIGIENIIKDEKKLKHYVGKIKEAKGDVRSYWSIIKDFRSWGRRWYLVIMIIIIVFSFSYLYVIPNFNDKWKELSLWLSGLSSIIIALIGNAMSIATSVWAGLKNAAKRLKSIQESFSERPEVSYPELDQKKQEISELNNSLLSLNKQIKDTRQEITEVVSGKKLLEFIGQRSRDENYARQLGLISWVRKDFDKLDELLRKQHQMKPEEKEKLINPQEVALQVDRIILYIDDLDRCNEEIVVRVLEAIHLLLAFPLFVVIVGVDPRWLNNALSEKYKMMFGLEQANGKKKSKRNDASFLEEIAEDEYKQLINTKAATSYDYLEKIFQITFLLKPISVDGRNNLIDYLLKKNIELDNTELKKKTLSSTILETNKKAELQSNETDAKPIIIEKTNTNTQEITTPDELKKIKEEEKRKQLTFSDEEVVYMQSISELFGHTPRTIGRYVNVYKIIKTHESLKRDKSDPIQDYRVIMFILAVVVGHPGYIKSFVQKLADKNASKMVKDVLNDWKNTNELKLLFKEDLLSTFDETPTLEFRKNLELISRFSFRSHSIATL